MDRPQAETVRGVSDRFAAGESTMPVAWPKVSERRDAALAAGTWLEQRYPKIQNAPSQGGAFFVGGFGANRPFASRAPHLSPTKWGRGGECSEAVRGKGAITAALHFMAIAQTVCAFTRNLT